MLKLTFKSVVRLQASLSCVKSFLVGIKSLLSPGIEQEWRLAQSNMEAASSGLYSASNELSVASVKVKSASGTKLSFWKPCFCIQSSSSHHLDLYNYNYFEWLMLSHVILPHVTCSLVDIDLYHVQAMINSKVNSINKQICTAT